MAERVLQERYAIQQRLGKNAGRQTLLARDLQTEELVAIKILTFGADFQWDDLKLFEREAETLQSLSHPAIPRYLDHFEFQTPKTKSFALVQSYIEAKSLAEWVKLGRTFDEKEILNSLEIIIPITMTYIKGGCFSILICLSFPLLWVLVVWFILPFFGISNVSFHGGYLLLFMI